MKTLLLTLVLFTSCLAKANISCIWTSNKAGITINYVTTCTSRNQFKLDSILEIIVSSINRKDTNIKVFVLVNYGRLSFPGENSPFFFSIGFDTLRQIDDNYIFDYYWNRESTSPGSNKGINRFISEEMPLDINSTNSKNAITAVGVKIIYDFDYRSDKTDWGDLIKAIVYAAQNPDKIKSEQKLDTVRYNSNGWYVSLSTIDTFNINKIIGRQSEIKEKVQQIPGSKKIICFMGC